MSNYTSATESVAAVVASPEAIVAHLASGRFPKLAAAYVKAWNSVTTVQKNATNPHFKNDYADLQAVLQEGKPAFGQNGLALFQAPGQIVGTGADMKVQVIGALVHESGETIPLITELPIGLKPTAQSAGSAITYARRYQSLAIFGMAPSDDDGEAASAPRNAPGKNEPEPDNTVSETKLLTAIAGASTVKQICTLEPDVRNCGTKEVVDAFVAKRRELRTAEKKKTE